MARVEVTSRDAGRFHFEVPDDVAREFAERLVRELEERDPVVMIEVLTGADRWTWDRRIKARSERVPSPICALCGAPFMTVAGRIVMLHGREQIVHVDCWDNRTEGA
jgi:hypothetical protein